MKKSVKLLSLLLLCLFINSILVSSSLDVTMSDQGSGVTDNIGNLLNDGNLTIEIYDSLSGVIPNYTEDFYYSINNGSWSVILGQTNTLSLEQNKIYYKDYYINGEDVSFVHSNGSNVDRQIFHSPLGDIQSDDLAPNLEVSGDLGVLGGLGVLGNLGVSGDLTVAGTTTALSTLVLTIDDNVVQFASTNPSNIMDIGWYGKYVDSGTAKYTGMFRDATDNKMRFFTSTETEPTTTVDTTGTGYAKSDVVVGDVDFTSGTMRGHILPDTNDAYDIGSAEYKIRDMYVSDNSLWIGDTHKVSISEGKMKFRKRKTTSVPAAVSTAGGNEEDALQHAGVGSLANMKLKHWKAYMRSLPGKQNAKISDIFRADADDYEEESGADSWLDSGNNVYLGATGNVGIGNTNPVYKLDVTGTSRFTDDINGNLVGNVTGTLTSPSDLRLKENIKPIKNPIESLQKINGVTYNMIDSKEKELGVIAQDVQKVLPEIVNVIDEEKEYLGVDYTQLVPVLIEAVKEQQLQIEKQQQEIDELKTKICTGNKC